MIKVAELNHRYSRAIVSEKNQKMSGNSDLSAEDMSRAIIVCEEGFGAKEITLAIAIALLVGILMGIAVHPIIKMIKQKLFTTTVWEA